MASQPNRKFGNASRFFSAIPVGNDICQRVDGFITFDPNLSQQIGTNISRPKWLSFPARKKRGRKRENETLSRILRSFFTFLL